MRQLNYYNSLLPTFLGREELTIKAALGEIEVNENDQQEVNVRLEE